jgi:flagellar basal-body rod modification protein FlgD
MGVNLWDMVASSTTPMLDTSRQASSASSRQTASAGTDGLNKQAFLQLLMTQMQSQDPLNPMDGQDFFAQLAQLTSLEQMWQMNDNMQSMVRQQQLLEAGSLIGRHVEGTDANSVRHSGVVTGVRVQDSAVLLKVDGVELPLTQVDTVES